PSIVSLHDYFLACPNGAYYRYPKAQPCALTPMSMACITAPCDSRSAAHKAVRVLRQYGTRRALVRAGSTLSLLDVSPFAAQVTRKFLSGEHARYVVRSPIDVEKDDPVDVARNRSFLYVGRLTEEKGVRLLAEIARDLDLPLTIAGDGPLLQDLKA